MKQNTKSGDDPRINKLFDKFTRLISEFALEQNVRSVKGDDLDKMDIGLDLLADKLSEWKNNFDSTQSRINGIQEVIISIATLDFSKKAKISDDQDGIDAIGSGLNALSEELQATTVSKDYLESILGSMINTLIVIDTSGVIIRVNQALLNLLGYTRDELEGHPVNRIFCDEIFGELGLRDMLEKENISNVETYYRTSDGRKIPMLCSASVIRDNKSDVDSIVCVAQDITKRKKNAEVLKESEEKYRNIFEHFQDLYYQMDMKGILKIVSPSIKLLTGYDAEERIGRPVSEVYFDAKDQYKLLRALYKTGSLHNYELKLVRKDRKIADVSVNAQLLYGKDGKPEAIEGVMHEITDRKRAEEALHESKEKYKMLTEGLKDVVLSFSLNGKVEYVSPAIKEFSGYIGEEGIGTNIAKYFVKKKELFAALQMIARVVKNKKPANFEFLFKPKTDREPFYVEISGKPVIERGKVTSILCIMRDISERKRAEDEHLAHLHFLKSLERIDRVFRKSTDYEEMMRDVLKEVLSIFDCDRAWMLYPCDPDAETYHIEKECTKPEYPGVMANGNDIPIDNSIRKRINLALNTMKPVRIDPESGLSVPSSLAKEYGVKSQIITAILPKIGKPWMFGLHQCSYARVWTEAEETLFQEIGRRFTDSLTSLLFLRDLRLSEEKYRQVIERANDGIVVIQDGLIKFVNEKMRKARGYKEEEILGQPFVKFLLPEVTSEIEDRFRRSIDGEDVSAAYETILINKNNSKTDVEISTGIMMFQERPADLVFIRDITERKKMEEELRKIEKLESIGLLAGGIAHDFNNLLAIMLGNVSLLLITTDQSDESHESLLDIEKAIKDATSLTNQLLTFSSGGAPVKETSDIRELVKETAKFILRGSKVKPVFVIDKNIWPVDIDRGQMNQVINNIVLNGADAMPEGGKIKVLIKNLRTGSSEALLPENENFVNISIKDNGTGIPEDIIDKVFDPFFSTKQSGRGFGLTTAYLIIKKHNGYLEVESKPNSGTVFSIYLPALVGKDLNSEKDAEHNFWGAGKILVMDDEAKLLSVSIKMLNYAGYEVVTAKDGDEAVRIFEEALQTGKPFDLLILDLTVPGGMGGVETLKKIKKIEPKVIAIAASGYSNDPVMSEPGRYGFQAAIKKPFNIKQLNMVLKKALKTITVRIKH